MSVVGTIGLGKSWLRRDKAVHSINAVASSFRYEPKGAWVYHAGEDWDFERFDTLDDAVTYIIKKLKGNGTVMCRGQEIRFTKVSDERAYFIDIDGRAKIVEL